MDIKSKVHDTKHTRQHLTTFNPPAFVRMWILDLIEVLMYEFHYDFIKNEYGSNSIKKCLISVIIQLNKNTIMIQRN